MADRKITENKAETTVKAKELEVAQTSSHSFKVIKEYAGINVGEVVMSDNKTTIAYMLQQGYWKEA